MGFVFKLVSLMLAAVGILTLDAGLEHSADGMVYSGLMFTLLGALGIMVAK